MRHLHSTKRPHPRKRRGPKTLTPAVWAQVTEAIRRLAKGG